MLLQSVMVCCQQHAGMMRIADFRAMRGSAAVSTQAVAHGSVQRMAPFPPALFALPTRMSGVSAPAVAHSEVATPVAHM